MLGPHPHVYTPTLWEQGTILILYSIIIFQNSRLPRSSECGVYTSRVSLFYIVYIAIISHNRLLGLCWKMLQLNTLKYTAKVSSRPFKSISLSGYGGKVLSPNVE